MAPPAVPRATYRVQLNRNFTFHHARQLVPYLNRLGISHLYTSPIFNARPGSLHGYDIVDPTRLNPELGTPEDFDALIQELRRHDMGLVLDIVPNHMAATAENPWWSDVLEAGERSRYARHFDVDWYPSGGALQNKVLLPVLGKPYAEALESGELRVAIENGALWLHYYERRLPLAVSTYPQALGLRLGLLPETLGEDSPLLSRYQRLLQEMEELAAAPEPSEIDLEQEYLLRPRLKAELAALLRESPELQRFVQANLTLLNGQVGQPATSFDLLDRLLAQQCFQLAFWRTAPEAINYRRFFDISDLVRVRVEDEPVFRSTHTLILRLVHEGKVDGLRIDHLDGLHDPAEYLQRLWDAAGETAARPAPYLVVEKILAPQEPLPTNWPAHGTTGYDFIAALNGLLVDAGGFQQLEREYQRLLGDTNSFRGVVYQKKRQVIRSLFGGELEAMTRQVMRLAQDERHGRDLLPAQLKEALLEISARLRVYRTYIRSFEITTRDRGYLEEAFGEATRGENLEVEPRALAFLHKLLLLEFPGHFAQAQRQSWLAFVMRWQRFTGPVMAKGLEDTAHYTYTPLLSLNEVGSAPEPALFAHSFHEQMQTRIGTPVTLNATSTHDTKRSEDVRARLHVLSEQPVQWTRTFRRWMRWNHGKRRELDGSTVPDPNEELLLYQTLLGAWPLQHGDVPFFKLRLQQYLVKALREAKVHSDWSEPQPAYEEAVLGFAEAILEEKGRNRFLADFLEKQQALAYPGALASITQLVLKLTCPGVPDFYQGTELWDFSLVDPDNRRPVDYEARAAALASLEHRPASPDLFRELLGSWRDGRLKLWATIRLLDLRRRCPELCAQGSYHPLDTLADTPVYAFLRQHGQQWLLVAAPRRFSSFISPEEPAAPWSDACLALPPHAPREWVHALTGERVALLPGEPGVSLGNLCATAPWAVLFGMVDQRQES